MATTTTRLGPAHRTQLIVESPMQLQITDSQGRRLGSLDGQTDFREQPTNEFMRLEETKNATINSSDVSGRTCLEPAPGKRASRCGSSASTRH